MITIFMPVSSRLYAGMIAGRGAVRHRRAIEATALSVPTPPVLDSRKDRHRRSGAARAQPKPASGRGRRADDEAALSSYFHTIDPSSAPPARRSTVQ
jgi:hypothetical protein